MNALSEEAENALNNGRTLLDEASGLDGENTLAWAMCNLPFRGHDESLYSENQGTILLLFLYF
jgi:hypothetical protein